MQDTSIIKAGIRIIFTFGEAMRIKLTPHAEIVELAALNDKYESPNDHTQALAIAQQIAEEYGLDYCVNSDNSQQVEVEFFEQSATPVFRLDPQDGDVIVIPLKGEGCAYLQRGGTPETVDITTPDGMDYPLPENGQSVPAVLAAIQMDHGIDHVAQLESMDPTEFYFEISIYTEQ
jgi:hypothetical protein